MNTRKITFQHPAFKYISPLDYWRFVIDYKLQQDPEELGWLEYNKREPGSVAGLLDAFSYMLKTVNREALSEKLIKKLHLLALQNVAMKKDKFPGQFRNNRGVSFGITRGKNGTEKGMDRIFNKKIEAVEYNLYDGRDEVFDSISRRKDECYFLHPKKKFFVLNF